MNGDDVGHGFQVGDKVVLVKPFRCSGDSVQSDADYDARLRKDQDTVFGVVRGRGTDEYINVDFLLADDNVHNLYTNHDCIELVGAREAEEAAIASIIKTIEAQGG